MPLWPLGMVKGDKASRPLQSGSCWSRAAEAGRGRARAVARDRVEGLDLRQGWRAGRSPTHVEPGARPVQMGLAQAGWSGGAGSREHGPGGGVAQHVGAGDAVGVNVIGADAGAKQGQIARAVGSEVRGRARKSANSWAQLGRLGAAGGRRRAGDDGDPGRATSMAGGSGCLLGATHSDGGAAVGDGVDVERGLCSRPGVSAGWACGRCTSPPLLRRGCSCTA